MISKSVKAALLCGTLISVATNVPAFAQEADDGAPATSEREIVVTARLRSESLMDVPVAVNALSSEKLDQYKVADLTDIGALVPNVIVGDYKINGGGSLSIRGISSPATQIGFEQPVSVSIDGVQTSAGRVAMLGFFDLDRVEVLRGPQTLFFGKNSPAGVISVVSAGPTRDFEFGGSLGYEFAGREMTGEGYVSGRLAGASVRAWQSGTAISRAGSRITPGRSPTPISGPGCRPVLRPCQVVSRSASANAS